MHDSHGIDLMLWNSFMGKAYSVSDCFKENGIGILARACKDAGLEIIIEDPAKIEFYTSFTKNDITPKLSNLFMHIFSQKSEANSLSLRKEWDVLQTNLSVVIKEKMEKYINDLAQKICINKVKVLGMKTWLGDRFTYSEKLALKVQELSPRTLVIAGGPQVNQFKTHALEKSPFDFCIDVEGEVTLVTLVKIVKEMYSHGYTKSDVIKRVIQLAEAGVIFNLIYRNSNGKIKETTIKRIPLNLKPFPLYEKEDGKVNIAVINESSGCYYGKCNFCTHPNITGKYQNRNTDITIKEIKDTIKEVGIGLFRFAGSATPLSLSKRIADAILKEGLRIEYSMFVRAVFLGAEVANDTILLNIMNKGNKVEDIYFTVKAIKQASYNHQQHIDVGISFIYPCPLPESGGITQKQVLEENLRFLLKLKNENFKPDSILVTPAAPMPLTPWQLKADQYSFKLPENFYHAVLHYEYELTKDPSTWPELDISLHGMNFLDMLKLAGLMEKKVREIGYTVNISDEHCLAARSAGFVGQCGLEEFKVKSDLALLTTDYGFLIEVYQKINIHSQGLAEKNFF